MKCDTNELRNEQRLPLSRMGSLDFVRITRQFAQERADCERGIAGSLELQRWMGPTILGGGKWIPLLDLGNAGLYLHDEIAYRIVDRDNPEGAYGLLIPWEAIDMEYKWAAMDKNGQVHIYTSRPTRNYKQWLLHNMRDDDKFTELPPVVNRVIQAERWQDTLIPRCDKSDLLKWADNEPSIRAAPNTKDCDDSPLIGPYASINESLIRHVEKSTYQQGKGESS